MRQIYGSTEGQEENASKSNSGRIHFGVNGTVHVKGTTPFLAVIAHFVSRSQPVTELSLGAVPFKDWRFNRHG
jgi:hypothetical protein